MNINTLDIPVKNKIISSNFNKNKTTSLPNILKEDTFVSSFKGITKKSLNIEDIKDIYDTVLRDCLKMNLFANPIIRNLKLEKPKIIIAHNSDMTGIACYNFPSNTISINEKIIKNDLYLCYSEDKESGQITTFGVYVKDELKKGLEDLKSLNVPIKTLKLNEKEKEFYIATLLAHEIRHFIQSHVMASSEGISQLYTEEQIEAVNKFNEFVPSYNENLRQIEQTVENCRKRGLKVIPELIEILNTQKPKNYVDTTYAKNYRPNSLLDRYTPFKFSMLPLDTRTITPLDFYNASNEKMGPEKNNENAYYSNLIEIDAYNHGFEYTYATKSKYSQGVRKLVIDGLAQSAQKSSLLGISIAKQNRTLPRTMYR